MDYKIFWILYSKYQKTQTLQKDYFFAYENYLLRNSQLDLKQKLVIAKIFLRDLIVFMLCHSSKSIYLIGFEGFYLIGVNVQESAQCLANCENLKNYKDISQLGMFETSTNHIKLVEWPDLIYPKPKNRIDIFFKYSESMQYRTIKINGFGKWKDYKFDGI